MTVTPVTYIRPDILIFTGVTHKEGNTSDSNTSDNVHEKCILQNIYCKVSNHVVNHGILTKSTGGG